MRIGRDVTPGEIRHFREKGWVVLRGYIDPDVTASFLHTARKAMGNDADRPVRSIWGDSDQPKMWQRYDDPGSDYPEFDRLGKSDDFVAPLIALIERDDGLRLWGEQIAAKAPAVTGMSGRTPWHQDNPYLPIDRCGDVTAWVALHDMEPGHGTMRFMDGSRAAGPLEPTLLDQADLCEIHPHLADRFPASAPLHMKAGDVTVHDGCTIHSAPTNDMPDNRWAYIAEYVPGSARAARLPHPRMTALGISDADPLDHGSMPLFSPAVSHC